MLSLPCMPMLDKTFLINEAKDINTTPARLLELVDDDDWRVRLAALRHPKTSTAIKVSRRFDKSWQVRAEAVMQIHDHFFLRDHLDDTHYMVKLAVIINNNVDNHCLTILSQDDDFKVALEAKERLCRIQKK